MGSSHAPSIQPWAKYSYERQVPTPYFIGLAYAPPLGTPQEMPSWKLGVSRAELRAWLHTPHTSSVVSPGSAWDQ